MLAFSAGQPNLCEVGMHMMARCSVQADIRQNVQAPIVTMRVE